jgi:uncharacterized small protein (DUF1192 family)
MATTVMRAGSGILLLRSCKEATVLRFWCRPDNGAAGALTLPGLGKPERDAMEEPAEPRKKVVHEIGQDLSQLSVFELKERILALTEEIGRIEQAIRKKESSKSAADNVFRK